MAHPENPPSDLRDLKQADREVEKKFLVREMPAELESLPNDTIAQGYAFIGKDGTEVRVRQKGETYFLTTKAGSGEVRLEQEREITKEEYEQLWSATDGRRLEKTRYRVPLADGATAELDVYGGDLDGLVTAEVEFDDAEAAAKFVPPDWLGDDVTEDKQYKNQSLAVRGRPGETRERVVEGNPEYDIEQGVMIATTLINAKKAVLNRPVIVELAGGSASGKTSAVGRRIAETYGDNAAMLSLDNYYRGGEFMAEQKAQGNELNFDQPEAVDLPLVAEHLERLRAGQPIEQPIYSFANGGTRTGTTTFPPREVIIAEGLFTLDKQLVEQGDVKIFVDIGTHGQFLRRIMRDVSRTDWSPQQIVDYFSTTVVPMHEKYVATTKTNADIVIRNEYKPLEEADRAGMYEQQLKFPMALTPEQLRKLGAEKISHTIQVDHYLNPHGRKLTSSDELLRIREEGDTKTLGYKGPRKADAPFRKRPKFEFDIDDDIEQRFLGVYGQEFETITKDRTIYRYKNTILSVDQVIKSVQDKERDLGTWTEVRFAEEVTPEEVEQITRALGLDPATARKESYIEM